MTRFPCVPFAIVVFILAPAIAKPREAVGAQAPQPPGAPQLILAGRLAAQTDWEKYKSRPVLTSVDQHLTDPALVGAVDLHAHSDPDSYPRGWDAFELVKLAKDRGLRGLVLKNHWTETAGPAYLARK